MHSSTRLDEYIYHKQYEHEQCISIEMLHVMQPCIYSYPDETVEAYPDETVMEMHSQELCWQVGVTGDMVPGDISDNLLC